MANEHMDQQSNEVTDKAKGVGKSAGKGAGRLAKKGLKRATKKLRQLSMKAIKKMARVAVNALKQAALWLISAIAPFLPIILIIVILGVGIWWAYRESTGNRQEYSTYELSQNHYHDVVNQYGDPALFTLSDENALRIVFYNVMAKDAYLAYVPDGDGGYETMTPHEAQENEIVDRHNREDVFKISPLMLIALDNTLNENTGNITGQTFAQPVPFRDTEDGLELIEPYDEDGELNIYSRAFIYDDSIEETEQELNLSERSEEFQDVMDEIDEDLHGGSGEFTVPQAQDLDPMPVGRYVPAADSEGRQVFEPGIWDYGFAPVFLYGEYTEERWTEGTVTDVEIWDFDRQEMRLMTQDELSQYTDGEFDLSYGMLFRYPDYAEGSSDVVWNPENDQRITPETDGIELYKEEPPIDFYLIEEAVTPVGTIRNDIEIVEKPSGKTDRWSTTAMRQVPEIFYEERPLQDNYPEGNTMYPMPITEYYWFAEDYTGDIRPDYAPESPDDRTTYEGIEFEARYRIVEWDENDPVPNMVGIPPYVTEQPEPIMTEIEEIRLVDKDHEIFAQGREMVKRPEYVGEPDTEDLIGLDYYIAYFENYENYTQSVINFLDLSKPEYGGNHGTIMHQNHIEQLLSYYAFDEYRYNMADGRSIPSPEVIEHEMLWRGLDNPEDVWQPQGYSQLPMYHVRMQQIAHRRDEQQEQQGHADRELDIDYAEVEDAGDGFLNAMNNHYDDFLAASDEFGVDPHLLMAIAAVESTGMHYRDGQVVQNAASGATGLMQVVWSVNGSGLSSDLGMSEHDLLDPTQNIRAGAYILAREMRDAGYDVRVGLQSYHSGISYSTYIRNSDQFSTWSPESIDPYLDHYQFSWVTSEANRNEYREYVPKIEAAYVMNESPNVPDTPWVETPDGEFSSVGEGFEGGAEGIHTPVAENFTRRNTGWRRYADIAVETLADTGAYIWNRATDGIWDGSRRIMSDVGSFFGLVDDDDDTRELIEDEYTVRDNLNTAEREQLQPHPDHTGFGVHGMSNKLSPTEAETLTWQILAYEEMENLSAYEELEPEDFEERFIEAFMQPVRDERGNDNNRVNPNDYFPNGYQSPIEHDLDLIEEYGHQSDGGFNDSIWIGGAPNDPIYAVADGTIIQMNENSIIIEHDDGIATVYSDIRVAIEDRTVDTNDPQPIRGESSGVGMHIEQGQMLGFIGGDDDLIREDAFEFQLRRRGQRVDPTWIVDPSLIGGGVVVLDENAGDLTDPFQDHGWAVTDEFRQRTNSFHYGMDFGSRPAGRNIPIRAMGDGVVVHSQNHPATSSRHNWGQTVAVRHDFQTADGRYIYTQYSHLDERMVEVGQTVQQGEQIGTMGNTGNGIGVSPMAIHLHLETHLYHADNWRPGLVRRSETAVNPRELYNFPALREEIQP